MISLSRDNVQRLRQAYEQRVHAEANGEPDPRAASILERVAGAVLRNEPYPAEPGPPSAPFT
jgi:hypothetical protein